MIYLFMTMFVAVGWSHDADPSQQSTPVEAVIQQRVDGIIKNQSIDIGIINLSMKDDSPSVFEMRGAAASKAHIADFIHALGADPQTSKVYLVSTEQSTINGDVRQVFVMHAAYSTH